jgi:hypothetical protein
MRRLGGSYAVGGTGLAAQTSRDFGGFWFWAATRGETANATASTLAIIGVAYLWFLLHHLRFEQKDFAWTAALTGGSRADSRLSHEYMRLVRIAALLRPGLVEGSFWLSCFAGYSDLTRNTEAGWSIFNCCPVGVRWPVWASTPKMTTLFENWLEAKKYRPVGSIVMLRGD